MVHLLCHRLFRMVSDMSQIISNSIRYVTDYFEWYQIRHRLFRMVSDMSQFIPNNHSQVLNLKCSLLPEPLPYQSYRTQSDLLIKSTNYRSDRIESRCYWREGLMLFRRALAWSETLTASSRFWTTDKMITINQRTKNRTKLVKMQISRLDQSLRLLSNGFKQQRTMSLKQLLLQPTIPNTNI